MDLILVPHELNASMILGQEQLLNSPIFFSMLFVLDIDIFITYPIICTV